VTALPGASQCDEQDVLRIMVGGALYAYDPGTVIDRSLLASAPEADAVLPADAVDTGLRRSHDELWMADDAQALYVVSGDRAQKWPRVITPFGCD